jgi:hypothetical protein
MRMLYLPTPVVMLFQLESRLMGMIITVRRTSHRETPSSPRVMLYTWLTSWKPFSLVS